MSFATTTVEVAFASPPLGGSYTWTDITAYVRSFDTKRGRSYELDQMQAGTATFQLDNKDGRFTPGLATGAYFPNVLPRRRIRVRATDPLGAGGAVTPTIDVVTTATLASATTMTWSHTVGAGSNRALFVDIGFTSNTDEVGTITYGAQSMTLVGAVQSGGGGTDRRVERWSLVAPAVGTATITVTFFNTTSHTTVGVTTTTAAAASTSMFGVDQVTPTATSATANGTAATTTGSLAPTVLGTDLVLTMVMARTTTTETPTGTTTSGTLLAGTNNYLGYGTAAGSTSWAWSVADRFAAIATPVHGAAGAGGTPVTIFTGFVESWAVSFDGGGPNATTKMTAVDGFKILGNSNLLRQYVQAVMTDSPKAYYPLGEAAGAPSATDLTGTYGAAILTPWNGGAPAAFGAPTIPAASSDTSLFLGGSPTSFSGQALTTAGPLVPQGYMPGSTGSVEFWLKFNAISSLTVGHCVVLGNDYVNGRPSVELNYDPTGAEVWNYFAGAVTQGILESVVHLTDLKPHHIVMTWGSNGAELITDGISRFSTATPTAVPALRDFMLGMGQPAAVVKGMDAQIQGVAFYSVRLTAAQALTHYKAGTDGNTGESESTRMTRVLDAVAWPSADRLLDPGLSALSACAWTDGANALQLCQGFATDAGGYVFVNGAGMFTLHNRQSRINNLSRVTFQESTGLGIEGDVQFHLDDQNIRNSVAVTNSAGNVQRVTDAPSIASYGTSAESLTLNITSANEALDAANWRLGLLKDPATRVETISIEPHTGDNLWQWALGLEIGDTVTLGGLPASAPAASMPFTVESINHVVTANGNTPEWRTRFELSPFIMDGFLVLDDPIYGRLDQNQLAY
jgi:hypothetical protein